MPADVRLVLVDGDRDLDVEALATECLRRHSNADGARGAAVVAIGARPRIQQTEANLWEQEQEQRRGRSWRGR